MTSKTLSAGDTIDARCTRCRDISNHTIVAMVGEKVVRVECNTCRGVHNYKEPKVPKTPADKPAARKKAAAPRRTKKDPGAADREEWASLSPTMDKARAVAYAMNGSYKVDALVSHPTFGIGIVKIVRGNKCEILFEEGMKLLRCQ
ncbi:MAG: hypothetical protein C0617_08985 [Desulfuromonas sp.]|uniref:hypothetical protein n=1 Tax=Desulfuromonas sp. TaxID=892 RepID=UPI000CAFF4B5|nr:hypothetical protein [Desulfuromonas sp.]PLX84201.1 MAG: hypothetical protein C0617_08985 [Desulfuromonas sp.]